MAVLKTRCAIKQILRIDSTFNRTLIVGQSKLSKRGLSNQRVGNKETTGGSHAVCNKELSVADFYAGKSIFITGATGFLGKAYIERLLYNCSQIENIFILIRQKNDVSVAKRMEELTYNPIFARLRKERPEDLKKIIPIVGDVSAPRLGISSKDEQLLLDKVSLVIHSAATVKVTEALSVAMKINFEGARSALELCRRMKNLHVFVYISTAYTRLDRQILREIVYPPQASVDEVYKFLEYHGDDWKLVKKFINKQRYTYTFTKSIAENYIDENHGEVPTIIIKPSIITSYMDEPEGWLEETGLTNLLCDIGNGVMRVAIGDDKVIWDLIPVDYVSNLIIVASAKYERSMSRDVIVYNSCSGTINPITFRDLAKYFIECSVKNNYNLLPYPSLYLTNSKNLFGLLSLLLEAVPANVTDLWRRVAGKRPMYKDLYVKMKTWRHISAFIISGTWVFHTNHLQALETSMSSADRKKFPFNPADIVWRDHIHKFCEGTIRYLGKKKQGEN